MAEENLKVLISWSGDLSKAVARVWHEIIDYQFDNVTPWMSDKNIELGTRNLATIASELKNTTFGIVVVTQENQNSQWLTYESGALSRDSDDPSARLVPSLVDFKSPSDLTGPLSQFQAGLLDKKHVRQTLESVASAVGADWAKKSEVFDVLWDNKYEKEIDTILKKFQALPDKASTRSPEDKIDELLTIVRDLKRSITAPQDAAKRAREARHRLKQQTENTGILLTDAGIEYTNVSWENSEEAPEILVTFDSMSKVPSSEFLDSLQDAVGTSDATICFYVETGGSKVKA